MYPQAVLWFTFLAAIFSTTLFEFTSATPLNLGLSERSSLEKRVGPTVVDCRGALPPLRSPTRHRNYPDGFDHPEVTWGTLQQYCISGGTDPGDHIQAGAGCRCSVPIQPEVYFHFAAGWTPECAGGDPDRPGYNSAAFDMAPTTEVCRQSCTCQEEPEVVPPVPQSRAPNRAHLVVLNHALPQVAPD